jgi:hypothetical protein
MDNLSLASPRQLEIPHEDVTRTATARVSVALRPSLVVAITRVRFCGFGARTRAAAKVRTAIIVVALAAFPFARIVVAAARIVGPSRIVEHRHLRRISERSNARVVMERLEKSARYRETKVD